MQELLWSGRKAVDYNVPRQTEHHARMEARQAAWQAEAARSRWCGGLPVATQHVLTVALAA